LIKAEIINMIPAIAKIKHPTQLLPDVSRVGPSIDPTANNIEKIPKIESKAVIMQPPLQENKELSTL